MMKQQETPPLIAQVKYLASADENNSAIYYASEAGVDQAKEHDGQFEWKEVNIQNGRRLHATDLDREGFQLIHHISNVQDYYNDDQIKEIFYKEVKGILLKHIAGAQRIEIFDHTRRASTSDLRKQKKLS